MTQSTPSFSFPIPGSPPFSLHILLYPAVITSFFHSFRSFLTATPCTVFLFPSYIYPCMTYSAPSLSLPILCSAPFFPALPSTTLPSSIPFHLFLLLHPALNYFSRRTYPCMTYSTSSLSIRIPCNDPFFSCCSLQLSLPSSIPFRLFLVLHPALYLPPRRTYLLCTLTSLTLFLPLP